MVAEKIERKLINHSNDEVPLHDKVACPFLHGFARHVHGNFRGQSAFGYFPPSSTVGVCNPTSVLTNTRALAHLSVTAWLIGLCPDFLHTQCCLKVLEHANKAAVDEGDKQDGIRGRGSAGEVHFASCFSDLEPKKLMKKTTVFLFGSNQTEGLPEIILS